MQETQRPSLIARFKGEATTGAPAPETSTGPEHTTATPHTVKIGDKLPFDKTVWTHKKGAKDPEPMKLGEVFRGKKAVLFGLPGAYTSVCSSKHVPEYLSKRQELEAAGVELLACASVNDSYVMHKWAQDLGVEPSAICMLADPDGSMHRALGLTQVIPALGERALRYSMFLDDGVIKILNIEQPGGQSYKVSGPSHMLEDLKHLKKQEKTTA